MGPIYDSCISVLEYLLSFLVISTFVVFFWRGTWGILDICLFPENVELSYWICFGSGNFVLIITGLLQRYIALIHTLDNCFLYILFSRLYIYIVAVGSAVQWRGVWNLQDHYFHKTWQSAMVSLLIGVGALCCLRCERILLTAPPLCVDHDTDPIKVYRTTGRLNSRVGCSPIFLIDMVMTPLLVHTLVVAFWRGLWTMIDINLYPHDNVQSAMFSLVTSFALAYPTMMGQYFVPKIVKKYDNNHKIAMSLMLSAYIAMASSLPVVHWRGIWILQDSWLIPENRVISLFMSHVIGFFGSVLLLSGKSIPVTGCLLDDNVGHDNLPLVKLTYFKKIWEHVCKPEPVLTANNNNIYKANACKVHVEEFTCVTHF